VPPRRISIEETSHYRITRGILQDPALWWRHLDAENEEPAES
jgi:hypothetical protein